MFDLRQQKIVLGTSERVKAHDGKTKFLQILRYDAMTTEQFKKDAEVPEPGARALKFCLQKAYDVLNPGARSRRARQGLWKTCPSSGTARAAAWARAGRIRLSWCCAFDALR